ncbi:MAG: glycoside hydrolase family 5 protein, partial [Planctomycetes bacterium]|nr:glycoside hydrolase family 5 protein [Planctomycetota bacterium]
MKNNSLLCMFGVFLLGLFCVSCTAEAADSLIPNGNFEADADGDASPDEWGTLKDACSWQEEGGNHFLRIAATEPGKMNLLYKEFAIPAETKALALSFRYRLKDFKKGKKGWFDARIMMNFKDAAGKKIGSPGAPSAGKDTEGWVEVKSDFLVPESTAKLEFMPCLFNVTSGIYDLDDFVLEQTDAEPIIQRKKEAEEK